MQKGFTIIELILVISILSILVVLYSSVGTSFLVRNNTVNIVNQFASDLRIAQLNSLSSKRDSAWGVRVQNNQIILFTGNNFATRDQTYDEIVSYPGTISISPNNSEVNFAKLSGDTTLATYTVTNNIGETSTIKINQLGRVNVN